MSERSTALLRVVRGTGFGLMSARVSVDGEPVGKATRRTDLVLELRRGSHQVIIHLDGLRNALQLVFRPDEEVVITCHQRSLTKGLVAGSAVMGMAGLPPPINGRWYPEVDHRPLSGE